MPNAFDIGVAAMFRDPNVAQAATYRQGGVGTPVVVRAVRVEPEAVFNVNGTRVVNDGFALEVVAADLPAVAEGDTFEIGADLYRVQAAPVSQGDGLIWRVDVVPL